MYSFIFSNDNGFKIECISYGAMLKAAYFRAKDKGSDSENKSIVLGYDNLDDYLKDTYFFWVHLCWQNREQILN